MALSHSNPYLRVAYQEAKRIGDIELLAHLSDANGNVYYVKNGMTLLEYARSKRSQSYKSFIRAIIKAGATDYLLTHQPLLRYSPLNPLNQIAIYLLTPDLQEKLKFSLKK